MVLSRLNEEIQYNEKRGVDTIDNDKKVRVYNGSILNKNIQFVIGNINYLYEAKNILYFSIYIVNREVDEVNFVKIGVYELRVEELETIVDNEGEVDIMDMESFLPFSYIKNILDTIE